MPKKSQSRGRAYLEKQLKKKGLSRAKAVPILNTMFAEIMQALGRGEEVEFPLGKLKVVRHKHRTQTGRFLNRELTTYKQPYTVAHETDDVGEWLLNSKPLVIPPKPGSPPGTKPWVMDSWKLKAALGITKPMKLNLPPKPSLNKGKQSVVLIQNDFSRGR